MGRTMFPDLIGNETIKNNLARDAAEGKTAHAYIIEGGEGSGRHLLSRLVFASSVCAHRTDPRHPVPCSTCPICRRILTNNSADVTVIGTEGKAGIGVDAIRKMRETLYITPNDGEKKVYIIEQAERMTIQAQNALLLSLEEPPRYVLFFLLTTHAAGLLETIRSRAPVVRMEHFSPKTMRDILHSGQFINPRDFTEDALDQAAYLSGGTIGGALRLLTQQDGTNNQRQIATKLAEGLCTRQKTSELLEFVTTEFPAERESVLSILTLTMEAIGDLLARNKTDNRDLLFYFEESDMPTAATRVSTKRLIHICDLLRKTHKTIAMNGSITTAMTELILKREKNG